MKKGIIIIISILCISQLLAQKQSSVPLHRQYATQKMQARVIEDYPEVVNRQSAIERYIADYRRIGNLKKKRVPVVFHILYAPGQPFPDVEDVHTQMEVLNEYFNQEVRIVKHKADTFEGYAKRQTSTNIEFCFARNAPDGNQADPIRFVETNVQVWGLDDHIKASAKSGVDPWNTEKYLNIWVGHLADTISGYAQMPGGPEALDGIVIDYRFFGLGGLAIPPYDEGKTLVHLVGNYLGLFDLWGENEYCRDDKVTDTPVHNVATRGCPGHQHFSTCTGNPVEMTMNFMDNTDDACQYMFTTGQMVRMHAVLSKKGPRGLLEKTKVQCKISEFEEELGFQYSEETAHPGFESWQALVFPSPAHSTVNIQVNQLPAGPLMISIYNAFGQQLERISLESFSGGHYQTAIDCQQWLSGNYFIQIDAGDRTELLKFSIIH